MTVQIKENSFDLFSEEGQEAGDWLCRVNCLFAAEPGSDFVNHSIFRGEDNYFLFSYNGLVDEADARELYRIWKQGVDHGYVLGKRDGRNEIVAAVHELLGVNALCQTISGAMEINSRAMRP